MNKTKKYILIIVCLIAIIVIVLSIISRKNYDKRIEKYITNLGFKLEDGLYYKQLSVTGLDYYYNLEDTKDTSFRGLYFNIDTYNLIYNKFDSINGTKLYFVGNYDYKDDSLTYTYRVLSGGGNAIFKGSYDRGTKELVCENDLSYDTDAEIYLNDACMVVEDDIDDFISEINNFIVNGSILKYMQNSNK